jgi:hypothetical protein
MTPLSKDVPTEGRVTSHALLLSWGAFRERLGSRCSHAVCLILGFQVRSLGLGANAKFAAAVRPETSKKGRDAMRGNGGVRVVFGIPLSGCKSNGGDMRRPACSNISVTIGCDVFLARPGIEVSEERDDITSRRQRLEGRKDD